MSTKAKDSKPAKKVTATGQKPKGAAAPMPDDQIQQVAADAKADIAPAAERAWDKTKDVTEKAWDKTKDVTEKAWDKTKDATEKAWDKTKDVAEDAREKIDDMRH